jgi:hypothetical protein
MRFLLSLLAMIGMLPVYLQWSREQAEEQIERMQEAAFNTPGAEAPVPAPVLLAGAGVLTGHFVIARFLRLNAWQALLSLFFGVVGGIALFLTKTGSADR